jgi:sulfur-carrier protein
MAAKGMTVRQVLDEVFKANPQLEAYVLDDQRELRKHMRILVNGLAIADRAKQSDAVQSDDEVWVMQALSGG